MARSRNIKPGFFENDELSEVTYFARLLFIGLWTLSDRRGILEYRPKKIKGILFPFDEVSVDDIDSNIKALASRGFVILYETDSKNALQIVNFSKHQNPHHREKENGINTPSLNDNVDSLNNNSYFSDSHIQASGHTKSSREERGKRKEERGYDEPPTLEVGDPYIIKPENKESGNKESEVLNLCSWIQKNYKASDDVGKTMPIIEHLSASFKITDIRKAIENAIKILDSEGRKRNKRPDTRNLFQSKASFKSYLEMDVEALISSSGDDSELDDFIKKLEENNHA